MQKNFSTSNIDKLSKPEKSRILYKAEILRLKFLEFLSTICIINFPNSNIAVSTNTYQYIPLKENAIYTNSGYSGANFNILI